MSVASHRSFGFASLACLSLFAAVAGCAPSLSTFQPAHVAPKGHAIAAAGFEAGIPTQTIGSVISAGRDLAAAAERRELTDAEKQRLYTAGVQLTLNPPSFGPHFALAYTVVDRLEASLRYAGSATRFGARYQILRRDTAPFDMTLGVGVSRFTAELPGLSDIPGLEVSDFSRWQIDVPLLIGTSRDYLRVWGGPRLLYTTFGASAALNLPYVNQTELASVDGSVFYYGAQGGIAVGYRHLFIGLEMTVVAVSGTAHLSILQGTTSSFDTSLSGMVVYPMLGLMGEI